LGCWRMIRTLVIPVLCGLAASPAALATPDPTALGASIDKATPKKANDRDPGLVAKAEILLDRAHVSPGEIDGLDGDNFRKAVRAFQQVNGLPVSGDLDAATWGALKRDGAPILKAYTITLADAAGPFTRAIPSNLEAMARLPGLSYTTRKSARTALGSRHPQSLDYLVAKEDDGAEIDGGI
jgi:peptidoglycan hydrolase-like protein with peptidoglycan-binding domain